MILLQIKASYLKLSRACKQFQNKYNNLFIKQSQSLLGKSVRSDWLIITVSMEKVQAVYFCLGANSKFATKTEKNI